MSTHADKTQENKTQSVANDLSQKQVGVDPALQFADNRPVVNDERKLQEISNNSPRAIQLKAIQEMANRSQKMKQTAQLQIMADSHSVQKQKLIQKKENNTGLPDNLKSGIENLSGYTMDDVKVHRNSDKPSQLNAHAYAQGTDIHLASGQEKHLPHEAWHVVQQMQGRVEPTMQMKGGVNDNKSLEKEADLMGAKSLQLKTIEKQSPVLKNTPISNVRQLAIFDPQELDGAQSEPLDTDDAGSVSEFLENFETEDEFIDTRGMSQLPLDEISANAAANKYGDDNDTIKDKINRLLQIRNSNILPGRKAPRATTHEEQEQETRLHSLVYAKYKSGENQAAIGRILAAKGRDDISVLYRGTGYAQALQIATEKSFGGVKPLEEGEEGYMKTSEGNFQETMKEQVGLGTANAKKTLNEWTERYGAASGYARFSCMLICAVRNSRDFVYFRDDKIDLDPEEHEGAETLKDLNPTARLKYIEENGGEAGVLADSRFPLLDVAIYRCVATPLFPTVSNAS